MRRRVLEALRAHFKPEFLNRVDEVIIFHALTIENIKEIVEIQLRNLRKRLAERKISMTLTERAKEFLAKEGFDPVYGARPLKRAIQRFIQDPLALKILQGEFSEGDTVEVDATQKNELIFSKPSARVRSKAAGARA
jgi:ATP-dependent Clp protease ATP-binding subunit ClpB